LFHLFDYYVDGKQGLGLPEMNLCEGFHSWETRRILAGVCADVGKEILGCSWRFMARKCARTTLAPRHKL